MALKLSPIYNHTDVHVLMRSEFTASMAQLTCMVEGHSEFTASMHGFYNDVHGLMSLMHYEFAASAAQPYNDVHGL